MNGVLVLDKPAGPTSFDMVARVRRAAGERRVGHAGTLDPLATGVLVLCLGEATKLVPYLMDADKEYRATALLGVSTDTDDADPGARVIARAAPEALSALTEESVRTALSAFTGVIVQRPPRFSALKVGGERLYDRARQPDCDLDEVLRSKERPVRIDEIRIEEMALPQVTFTVRCGKGTYIRSLARDLGEALSVGGHLTALRRLRVGRLSIAEATALSPDGREFCGAPRLFGPAQALAQLLAVSLTETEARRVRNGQRAMLDELGGRLALPEGQAALGLDPGGGLCAVFVRKEGRLSIGRGFAG